jgi:type I restriction enzyme R subunit
VSQFAFLKPKWPEVHEAMNKAETAAFLDPRTSCFLHAAGARLLVGWMFKHDRTLHLP